MAAKGINKRIIGLMIGTTVAGVAKMASTEKGKQQLKTRKDKAIDAAQSAIDFVQWGIQEMKKQTKKKDDPQEGGKS